MTIFYRTSRPEDTHTLFLVSERATEDFARRQCYPWDEDPDDPALWTRRQAMFAHLAARADQCWLAENEAGEVIGYARSVVHAGVRELTEFFVLPGKQSAGVGRELLAQAFPVETGVRRFIVATSDARALGRYLKAGVYPRFPLYDFRRAPEPVVVETDLSIEPMGTAEGVGDLLAAIDAAVLGFRRDADHAWLAKERAGFVAYRDGAAVGYGYLGDDSGPFAVLAAGDMPALLAHAETQAHSRGMTDLGFEAPLINRAAVDYLLGRGYKMQPFFAFLMSDEPMGMFENYVVFSPPYFI